MIGGGLHLALQTRSPQLRHDHGRASRHPILAAPRRPWTGLSRAAWGSDGAGVPLQRPAEPLGRDHARAGNRRRRGTRVAVPVRARPVRHARAHGHRGQARPATDERLLVGRRAVGVRVLHPTRRQRWLHAAAVADRGRRSDQHQGAEGQVPAAARRANVPLRGLRHGARTLHQHDRDAARPRSDARRRTAPWREPRARPRLARAAVGARGGRRTFRCATSARVSRPQQSPSWAGCTGRVESIVAETAGRARPCARQHHPVPVRQPGDGERR